MTSRAIHLAPAELTAIEDHRYYMSLKEGREVSFEQAMEDFIENYRTAWLWEKQRRDNEDQLREIEKHRWCRSQEEGRDIGRKAAFEEWITGYAHLWRQEKESLQANGFLQATLVVEQSGDLWMMCAEIALRYDCDMHFHHRRMAICSFVLKGKQFLSVRSARNLGQIKIAEGEEIELIVTGAEGGEALEAAGRLLGRPKEG